MEQLRVEELEGRREAGTDSMPAAPDGNAYRYFRVDRFRQGLSIPRSVLREAQQLLERGEVRQYDVRTGYFSIPAMGRRIIQAEKAADPEDPGFHGHITVHSTDGRWYSDIWFDRNGIRQSRCGRWECVMRAPYAKGPVDHELCVHEACALLVTEQYLRENNPGDATSRNAMDLFIAGSAYSYFLEKGVLHRISRETELGLRPLARCADAAGTIDMKVGRSHLADFYRRALPELRRVADVEECSPEEIRAYLPLEPSFVCYLDAVEDCVLCRPEVFYNDHRHSPMDIYRREENPGCASESWRDLAEEERLIRHLERYMPEHDLETDLFLSEKGEAPLYEFLEHGLAELLSVSEVRATERFNRLKVRGRVPLQAGVSLESGIMNLELTTEELSPQELTEVLSGYRRKANYVRLKNGDFFRIEQNETIKRLIEMMDSLHITPKLKAQPVVGTAAERKRLIAAWQDADVLVTSYDLLKRDIAEYEEISFRFEIIDEAQYIKNHLTAVAKTVKLIRAKTKYALTGTPVENRLSDLWSIFDYLMPGFLYEYGAFRSEIELPAVKYEDLDAMEKLHRMAGPFILRRSKKEVLKDLPDKLEEIRYARFNAGSEQEKLYNAEVVHMRKELRSQTDEDFRQSRIRILAALTRIRQICCDPRLLFDNYRKGSAKTEACLELIRSVVEGEHKALVFSQFTSMLALLEEVLVREGIDYYKITGSTPKEVRAQLVKAFNEDAVSVFLISLKAGGTGLNLTGADVVIHYAPWWNVAAQNQATDRAHRIGQTKVVTVYRLILKGTIENRIVELQESKKALADEILAAEAVSSSRISREDLLELLR